MGQHELDRIGVGPRAHLRDQALRVRRPVQPRHPPHDPQRDPAHGRRHAGAAVTRRLRDRAHRAPHPVDHGADARPVAVDADARQLPGRQEGGDGAALADLRRSSRATTSASSASARWPASSSPSSCPRSRGTSCTARTCSTGSCSAGACSPARSGTKQIIMITDGEPTAHITPDGEVFFNYPPVPETVEATLREVARCTREGIRINTFMLDANGVPEGVRRAAHADEPGPGVLHDARDPRRLRARRLHRAEARDAGRTQPFS